MPAFDRELNSIKKQQKTKYFKFYDLFHSYSPSLNDNISTGKW